MCGLFILRFLREFLMASKPTYEELEQRVKILEKEFLERKRAEEDLRHQKKHLESLIEYSPLAIVKLDEKHNVTSCNRDFEGLFGFKESEIIGKQLDKLIADQENIHDATSYTKKTFMGTAIHGTGRRHRKDGAYIDVQIIGVPVIIDGKLIGAYGIYQDISHRKQAEAALLESEEKFRLISEQSLLAIGIIQDGHIKYTNEMYAKITGYSLEEIYGWEPYGYVRTIYKDDLAFVMDQAQKKQVGETDILTHYRFRGFTKARKIVWWDLYSKTVSYQGRPADLFTLIDVSEHVKSEEDKKTLQKQLQNAQKLEAIGTLAGGIAHDFNNLLAGIQGRASIVLMDKDSSHPDFEHLTEIESHVSSAADLTRQLLGFAKGGKYEVRPTDLNELIKKEARMFGRTRKEIRMHGVYDKNLWKVRVDRGQIEQVLLNLYVNAWQAMNAGGDLHVKTRNVILDEDYTRSHDVESGRYVQIAVSDTGVGMDEATREKIFDPFFTTKEMGRGTGLGLASVYGIIKNHGGFIDVDSEKGHGSTFNIYLPASKDRIIEEKQSGQALLKGSETILFVDDEDILTEFAEDLLGALGYKVLVAGSGKEAIEIYEKNKAQIDLVLLDMIMPGMGGGDTYERLKNLNSNVKVLLSSGYSIDGQASDILDRGCNGFIQKPFKMKELSEKLREILDTK